MSEGCRLVSFNQKMSCPGKAICHHRPEQRVPRMSNDERNNQRTQAQQSAGGVHGPVALFTVYMQVEGKELFIAGKLLLRHLVSPCPSVEASTKSAPDHRQWIYPWFDMST